MEIPTFKELGLCEQLAQACENIGWKTPSRIQHLLHDFSGGDLSVLAPHNAGVTAAFALSILNALFRLDSVETIFAFIVTPMRDRAIEVCEQWQALGHYSGVKCRLAVDSIEKERHDLSKIKCPHIVVGTPAEVVAFWSANTETFGLQDLKYLVLDCADQLVEACHKNSVEYILQNISPKCNIYLCAETLTEEVQMLNKTFLKNPKEVEIPPKSVLDVDERYCLVPAEYKDCYLVSILSAIPSRTSIVFTSTSESTRFLYHILESFGLNSVYIYDFMREVDLVTNLIKFRDGCPIIIICTDVPVHSLELPHVDLVINYDLPKTRKGYLYCLLQTGCVAHAGAVLNLVYEDELSHLNTLAEELWEFPVEKEMLMTSLESVKKARDVSIRNMDNLESKGKSEDNFELEATTFVRSHTSKYQNKPRTEPDGLDEMSPGRAKFASYSSRGRGNQPKRRRFRR